MKTAYCKNNMDIIIKYIPPDNVATNLIRISTFSEEKPVTLSSNILRLFMEVIEEFLVDGNTNGIIGILEYIAICSFSTRCDTLNIIIGRLQDSPNDVQVILYDIILLLHENCIPYDITGGNKYLLNLVEMCGIPHKQ